MATSLKLWSVNDSSSIQSSLSYQRHSPTETKNTSLGDGCMEVRFSQMEYLPWNNPDNIVSADVEITVHRMKNIMLVILFLIGGPANVINMAVFIKQGLKDRVNLCLFALSLADELYLILGMLLYAEQVYFQFITKEKYGPMFTFLTNNNITFLYGLLYVSPILSAIIATERCLCILSPLKVQTLLRTRTMAAIVIAVYVIVLGVYVIVSFRFHVGCAYEPDADIVFKILIMGEFYAAHTDLINFLDGVLFAVGLPAVVIMVVMITTIITIVKLRQIVTWRASTTSSISAREVELTKMLVGISIFFIACVSPVALIRISWFFFPEMKFGRRHENFFVTTMWIIEILSCINATFNFFVYYAMGSRYRETFWALFGRKLQSDKTRISAQQQQEQEQNDFRQTGQI